MRFPTLFTRTPHPLWSAANWLAGVPAWASGYAR